ncbi:hypothetical protein TKK_0016166 [Trichogramma kaykai]
MIGHWGEFRQELLQGYWEDFLSNHLELMDPDNDDPSCDRASNYVLVQGHAPDSRPLSVWTLLDACSEIILISDRIVARLKAPTEDDRTTVATVGGSITSRSRRTAPLHLHLPGHSSPIEIRALCLKHLGITTPCHRVAPHESSMWSQLKLADPRLSHPGPVDLLLEAGVAQRLMMTGLQRHSGLITQYTVAGWTIWGRSCGPGDQRPHQCLAMTVDGSEPPWHRQLLTVLQQFWQVEDLSLVHRPSPADKRCEQLFMEHHHRDRPGRYVVRLPFKPDAGRLLGSGESSGCASLAHLHRRMAQDATFTAAYREFMQAYINLGHMVRLSHEERTLRNRPALYIPHHGIWQDGDHGPRLRVVFDASRPT